MYDGNRTGFVKDIDMTEDETVASRDPKQYSRAYMARTVPLRRAALQDGQTKGKMKMQKSKLAKGMLPVKMLTTPKVRRRVMRWKMEQRIWRKHMTISERGTSPQL